jgi:hypothetical protein
VANWDEAAPLVGVDADPAVLEELLVVMLELPLGEYCPAELAACDCSNARRLWRLLSP